MKISLTLFRYSLPDGTQQKQLEGGYIVREKILESVSLRKLRTHRLNVLSFLDRRADKWGANTYFASEFNHAGIVDMLSWNKQVFERLLRESVEDIKTKDKDNAKELAVLIIDRLSLTSMKPRLLKSSRESLLNVPSLSRIWSNLLLLTRKSIPT